MAAPIAAGTSWPRFLPAASRVNLDLSRKPACPEPSGQVKTGKTENIRNGRSPLSKPVTPPDVAELPRIWNLFDPDALTARLLLLAKMIERATSKQLQAEYGISVAQWRVLAFVCMSGPATASFIGEAAEVDQAEISRAVKLLMGSGLVIREFEPGSRKTMMIVPTTEGEARYREIRARRQRFFSSITAPLAPDERIAFSDAMNLIAGAVVAERKREV